MVEPTMKCACCCLVAGVCLCFGSRYEERITRGIARAAELEIDVFEEEESTPAVLSEAEIERIIDALASRNQQPRIVSQGNHSLVLVDEAFDFAEQSRAISTIRALATRDDTKTWRGLLEHQDDGRYCITVSRNDFAYNWTVAKVCTDIAYQHLVYPFHRHIEDLVPRADHNTFLVWNRALGLAARYGEDLRGWARERPDKALFELQIEVCEWGIQKLRTLEMIGADRKLQVIAEVSQEIERLREGRKVLISPMRFRERGLETFGSRMAQRHRQEYDKIMAHHATVLQERDAIIDAFASRNDAPRIVKLGDSYVPIFARDYDWDEQDRVLKALAKVDDDWDKGMLVRLLERRNDVRYAMTCSENDLANNISVGELCMRIVVERLRRPVEKILPRVDVLSEIGMPDEFENDPVAWATDNPESGPLTTVGDLQIKVCRAAVAQIRHLKSISDEAKTEAIRRIEVYTESRKAHSEAMTCTFEFPGYRVHLFSPSEAEQMRGRFAREQPNSGK